MNRTRRHALGALLLAALLVSAQAFAGVLQFRDSADLFTPDQEASLRQRAASYPFDVRVLSDNSVADREQFNRYVAAQVSSPNMVVIGVSPSLRRTSVHFGRSTGIASSRYRAIDDAGDAYFRQGDWSGGVGAILNRAAMEVGTAPTSGASPAPSREGDPAVVTPAQRSSGFPWGLLLCGLGGFALLAVLFRAMRARSASAGFGGALYRQGGYGPDYNQGYGPNYGPGYGPQGGSGMGTAVGAGLAGAALGGLAGYAAGRAMGDDERDFGQERQGGFGGGNDGGGGFDGGGSSSGWDDGGGGGGGFDGGGGGFDGGGGGSDW